MTSLPAPDVRPHPLLGAARHGELEPGPVKALIDARDAHLLHALATNTALDDDTRDLVVEAACDPRRPVAEGLADPRTMLARQVGLTGAQRRRIVTSADLRDDVLGALVPGGPIDGVFEAVVAHLDRRDARLAEIAALDEDRRAAALALLRDEGPGPVVRAAVTTPGFDQLRVRMLPHLDDVSDFLAGFDPDQTDLDAVDLVAGLPFAPPNFSTGMAGMLRWPGAADVVDPRTVTGLVVVAAVATDRAVHRRALAEAHRRLQNHRTTDAEKLAESLATNPAVREGELEELVRLRDLLVGGYLHSWFPVPGEGLRADQLRSETDRQRLLRVIGARPELSRRGVWVAATVAMSCETRETRDRAIELLRRNRWEGLDESSLAWVAGRLGMPPSDLVHRPARESRLVGAVDVPAAPGVAGSAEGGGTARDGADLRPSEVGRLEARRLQEGLGSSPDAWAVLEVVCRDNPEGSLGELADAARAIAGVGAGSQAVARRRGAA